MVGTLDYNLQNKISDTDKKAESSDLEKKLEKVEENQSYLLTTVQDIQLKFETAEYDRRVLLNEAPEYAYTAEDSSVGLILALILKKEFPTFSA